MKKKINIGVLFGGKSAEHEVSIESAKNIMDALDKKKYKVIKIKISKKGNFNQKLLKKVDVVFPILHGPFGEDGTIQGLLKMAGIPFVGASVLGSAVGMDKDVMKRLLREAGIPIGKFVVLQSHETIPSFRKVKKELRSPIFIKPANMGSSVGVYKVPNESEYKKGIKNAFCFDNKIILEEFIEGKEIECAVLGNEQPKASILGEVIPTHEFYSYNSKYVDKQGADLQVPAKISPKITKKIQELAIKTFQTLECEGLGRVDCFLQKNGKIIINEINTIPGFTKISMYPKLWEASGIPYAKLINKLIQLALKRFKKEQRLRTNYKK